MAYSPEKPYNDLPLLPPAKDVETKSILKQCLTSTRALAELKGSGGLIPDQSILINAIPLQEAKLSSEIENIVTTQDELFIASIDETKESDPNTKEVLRYRTALRIGYEELQKKKFTLETLKLICSTIKDQKMQFRTKKEMVAIGNPVSREIFYSPPEGGKALTAKLKNLEDFIVNQHDIDPLIRMAIAHYQFEAIHPFTDGNGRTGRILNILVLLQAELLKIPVLYLSRFIIQHKKDYYRLLREVTESEAWEPWVLYMLQGIEETAVWTKNRIEAIHLHFEDTVTLCRDKQLKCYTKELIELIFRLPYCKISSVVDAGLAKRQAAAEYLKELEEHKIITSIKRGRENIYIHSSLIDLLKE